MLWLYRFLNGYLKIEIRGEFPERLINKCVKNNILLWNIKYLKEGISCFLSIRDFRRLFKIRKGLKISVRIHRKCGLPFLVNSYKHRYGLFIGIVLFIVLLQFVSGFIWNIEINGNKNVTDEEILNECKELGIEIGTAVKSIDTKISVEKLLMKTEKLAWAAFNIEGCVLTVDVTETKEKIIENSEKPTNIKAAADGVITKIDVKVGNCVVKIGDRVQKNDILVSGILEGIYSTEFVHSVGNVYATTERSYTVKESFSQIKKVKNKNITKRRALSVFGIEIPLYLGRIKNDYMEVSKECYYLLSKKIPITIYEKTYVGFAEEEITYKSDELLNMADKKIEDLIKKDNITEYKVIDRNVIEKTDEIVVNIKITAEENIAYQDILLFSSAK